MLGELFFNLSLDFDLKTIGIIITTILLILLIIYLVKKITKKEKKEKKEEKKQEVKEESIVEKKMRETKERIMKERNERENSINNNFEDKTEMKDSLQQKNTNVINPEKLLLENDKIAEAQNELIEKFTSEEAKNGSGWWSDTVKCEANSNNELYCKKENKWLFPY